MQRREGEAARDELRQERNSMRRTQQKHMHHMEIAASQMQALQVRWRACGSTFPAVWSQESHRIALD